MPGGERVAANQVLYNLATRAASSSTCCRGARARGIDVMAYSPLDEGRLVEHPALAHGRRRGSALTPAQVALAWVLRDPSVVAIPKAAREEHVRANRAAADLVLDAAAPGRARPRLPAAAAQNGARDDLKSARATAFQSCDSVA